MKVKLLLCRSRKFRYQPQRDSQFIQLEVRTEMGHRTIGTRSSGNFFDLDSRFAQRPLSLRIGGSRVVRSHILRDPRAKKTLCLFARHELADLVPADDLQIVREA